MKRNQLHWKKFNDISRFFSLLLVCYHDSIKSNTRCLARNEPTPQANPFVTGYTDREGSEKENRRKEKVRRKNGHSPFSLHSPTYSLKQDTDAGGGG